MKIFAIALLFLSPFSSGATSFIEIKDLGIKENVTVPEKFSVEFKWEKQRLQTTESSIADIPFAGIAGIPRLIKKFLLIDNKREQIRETDVKKLVWNGRNIVDAKIVTDGKDAYFFLIHTDKTDPAQTWKHPTKLEIFSQSQQKNISSLSVPTQGNLPYIQSLKIENGKALLTFQNAVTWIDLSTGKAHAQRFWTGELDDRGKGEGDTLFGVSPAFFLANREIGVCIASTTQGSKKFQLSAFLPFRKKQMNLLQEIDLGYDPNNLLGQDLVVGSKSIYSLFTFRNPTKSRLSLATGFRLAGTRFDKKNLHSKEIDFVLEESKWVFTAETFFPFQFKGREVLALFSGDHAFDDRIMVVDPDNQKVLGDKTFPFSSDRRRAPLGIALETQKTGSVVIHMYFLTGDKLDRLDRQDYQILGTI